MGYSKFQDPRTTQKERKKNEFNFFTQVSYFLFAPCKISEPYNNFFWEKSNPAERRKKKEREITPLIVDT
jgi:hypothetical protein